MPGINSYLNREFKNKIAIDLPGLRCRIKNLVMINMSTMFDFLWINAFDIQTFRNLLKSFDDVLKSRTIRFTSNKDIDTYLRARSSFDEVYYTELRNAKKHHRSQTGQDIILNIIDSGEEILDSF